MPDKVINFTNAIILFCTAVLGALAKFAFVTKSQVFNKSDGKPLFRYADTCAALQQKCADRTCAKIGELKEGQSQVKEELKSINELLVRIDQRVIDHDKVHKDR